MDLEPLVALQYASLRGEIKTPEDFYTKLDVKAYKPNAKGKMISSTSYTLIKERTMTPAYLALSSNLEPKYFRRIDFRKLYKQDQEFTLDLLEAVALRKGDKFHTLNLSGCEIDDTRLIRILEKMTNLQELNLLDCKGTDIMTIVKLLSSRPNATIFTNSYKVLCPRIQIIKSSVKGKSCVLNLSLTLVQRQILTGKLRDFMQKREKIVQRLIRDLRDPKEDHHFAKPREAAKALGLLGETGEMVIDALLTTVGDSNQWARLRDRALHFTVFKKPQSLLRPRSNSDWDARQFAILALGEIGKAEFRVIDILIKALDDSEWYIRQSAVSALGQLVVDKLMIALNDPNENPRKTAVKSLARIENVEGRVIGALIKVLSDSDWHVRECSLEVLGRIGKSEKGVIDKLLIALNDPNENVRKTAVKSLARIENVEDKVIDALIRALGDSDCFVGECSLEVLGRLGNSEKRVIDKLLMTLSSSNIKVRRYAIRSLGRIKKVEDRVIESLLKVLNDSESSVRVCALEVLGRLSDSENRVIEALLKILDNFDSKLLVAW